MRRTLLGIGAIVLLTYATVTFWHGVLSAFDLYLEHSDGAL